MLTATVSSSFALEVSPSSLYIRIGKLAYWIKHSRNGPRLRSCQRETGSAELWAGRFYVVVDRQAAAGSVT